MIRTTLCAAFVLAMTAGAGNALPAASKTMPQLERDNIVEVQHRKNWRHNQWRHRNHWRHQGRRHGPPPGWRRYHSRPWDYQRRGCIMFGPVWFCP